MTLHANTLALEENSSRKQYNNLNIDIKTKKINNILNNNNIIFFYFYSFLSKEVEFELKKKLKIVDLQ